MVKLTDKQQKFIDCYDGDIKKAAKKAGISYTYARELHTKPHILKKLRSRPKTKTMSKKIASREERQKFWSDVMNDPEQSMKDRLKASELLGKSEMDFPNRTELTGADGEPLPPMQVNILDSKK